MMHGGGACGSERDVVLDDAAWDGVRDHWFQCC